MGFLDDLKGWFTREGAAARELRDGAVEDGNASLDRAERRLAATPDERLQATLDDIAAGDVTFAEIQAEADAAAARPLAQREVAKHERVAPSPPPTDPPPPV